MNSFQRASVLLGFCIALQVSAQVASSPGTSDTAWQDLLQAGSPAAGQPQTLVQEIAQLQQEAKQASSFYSNFPSDLRASGAKKLEALSDLQAVQLGASASFQTTAVAVANAFINDASQGIQDRFDVALSATLIAKQASLKGQGPADNGVAYEAIADSLHAQFGDVAPVYSYYLGLTMSADNATAVAIASKIQTMNAPNWAKAQAQLVLSRAALVGTAIPLTLTNTSNQTIDLSQPTAKVTVVYLWGGSASMNDLVVLSSLKGSMPSGAQWIYVALNSPSPALSAVQAQVPFAGTQCFDPVNLAGFVPQTLFDQITPYAYVFDGTGKLVGYGPPILIPSLLAAAGL